MTAEAQGAPITDDSAAVLAALLMTATAMPGTVVMPRWGFVTSVAPIRVQFPGEAILNHTPLTLCPVSPGDNVLTMTLGARVVIIGVAGGGLTGQVLWLATPTVPSDCIVANGQALNRVTYARLFSRIDTTWGVGDGSTTFNVPNMVDRVPVGAGGAYALGATPGAATHDHIYRMSLLDNGYAATGPNAAMGGAGDAGAYNARTSSYVGGSPSGTLTQMRQPGGTAASGTVNRYVSDGYTSATENLPPAAALIPVIKT